MKEFISQGANASQKEVLPIAPSTGCARFRMGHDGKGLAMKNP